MDTTRLKQSFDGFNFSLDEYNGIADSLGRKIEILEKISVPKDFFYVVADFHKFIRESDLIVRAIDFISSEFEDDREEVNKLGQQVKDETAKKFSDLKKIALENKLISPEDLDLVEGYYLHGKDLDERGAALIRRTGHEVIVTIREYYSWLTGKSQAMSSVHPATSLRHAIEGVVMSIYESGHQNLVSDYVEVDKESPNKIIKAYRFSNTVGEFMRKDEDLKKREESSIWRCFQNIELVPLCMYDYRNYMEHLNEKNKFIEMLNLSGVAREMSDILEERRNRDPVIFKIPDYRIYIYRVYDRLLDVLKMAFQNQSVVADPIQEASTVNNGTTLQVGDLNSYPLPEGLVDAAIPDRLKKELKMSRAKGEGFVLRFGSKLPIFFAGGDIANAMNVFLIWPGRWMNYEFICKHIWPDLIYSEEVKKKGRPVHDKIRTVIQSIRDKKLSSWERILTIQSGTEYAGSQGQGFFRLNFVTQ